LNEGEDSPRICEEGNRGFKDWQKQVVVQD
jgi:hypothetical protein